MGIWRESDKILMRIWQESDWNLMGSDGNLTMMIDDSYFMDYIKQLGKGLGNNNNNKKKQSLGGLR